jgi:hypothetical protein
MGLGRLRAALLGISEDEVTFERRGFLDPGAPVRDHLEDIGRYFVRGYMAALDEGRGASLERRLDALPAAFRGFAYEGAAMALALLDVLFPWRSRLRELLAGPGDPHSYLVHVGAGWALARLPVRPARFLARLEHPQLRWLAMDGFGFHQGYFHPRETVEDQEIPRRVRGYQRRAFDQGLGRSLWFVRGAQVDVVADTIGRFPEHRRGDLWSGVGLAVCYAGGVDAEAVERLGLRADRHRADLAQGAAFAAEARARAGNLTPATERTCEVLTGVGAAEAARWSRECGDDLPPDRPQEPAFEVWRQRIMERWRRRWGRAETSGPRPPSERTRHLEGQVER